MFDIWVFHRKSFEKIQVSLKSAKNNGDFTWRLFTFMIISRWIIFKMTNVSDKSCRENQNTQFMLNKYFSETRAVYEMIWKYGEARHATYDSIIRRMRFACWITKATHTNRIHANAPQTYVIRTVPVLLVLHTAVVIFGRRSFIWLITTFYLAVNTVTTHWMHLPSSSLRCSDARRIAVS